MLRLAKAFLDIALWRQTPAHLPASMLLLALTASAAALVEVFGALLPPPPNGQIPARILLEVIMPLAFTWILLATQRRQARFLQTASAQFGVGVLAGLLLYPLNSVLQVMGQENVAALPVGVLYMSILIGYLLAGAHIWRSALDSGLPLGLLLSFGYFVASVMIENRVITQT